MNSRDFWANYQVAEFDDSLTAEDSLRMIAERNELYPGITDLMPTDLPGENVLDFGCGPGIDTVSFLLSGAAHVFAADISPKAIEMVSHRVKVHGLEDRCTPILIRKGWQPPLVDYVHAAGVIHHCEDPVATLAQLRTCLAREIRMMVYDADSWFYVNFCRGDDDVFRVRADSGAPIAHAWKRQEVTDIATDAGLQTIYLGSYRHPNEPEDTPGLSACYSCR